MIQAQEIQDRRVEVMNPATTLDGVVAEFVGRPVLWLELPDRYHHALLLNRRCRKSQLEQSQVVKLNKIQRLGLYHRDGDTCSIS